LTGVAAGAEDDGWGKEQSWTAQADPLARAVLVVLVLACFAAFFITQHLKHTPTAVQAFELTPFFSPGPSGHLKQESISFKLAHADQATVAIIDSDGNVVATLVRYHPVARYKQFSLRWNGRAGTAHHVSILRSPSGRAILVPHNRGALAPAGEYRVRVSLRHEGLVLTSPRSFTLVTP
jgi:hypothetical protein